jgi:hypothetical protein
MTTIHKIPMGVKTFHKNRKYVMKWTVKELNLAIKNYLKLGGFDILRDKNKLRKFCNEILTINPKRSKSSIEMIIFNIARCDKQCIGSGSLKLWGGHGELMLKILKKMDPNEVRFVHTFQS